MRTRLILATALSLSMIGVAAFALNYADDHETVGNSADTDQAVVTEMPIDADTMTETEVTTDSVVETVVDGAAEAASELVDADMPVPAEPAAVEPANDETASPTEEPTN